MDPKLYDVCHHDDIHHGFVMAFYEYPPHIDIAELEKKVKIDISRDLPVTYADESHIMVGDIKQKCNGPRTHVTSTGRIEGFRLCPEIIFDNQRNRYLLIGFVGENSQESLEKLLQSIRTPEMMSPFVYK